MIQCALALYKQVALALVLAGPHQSTETTEYVSKEDCKAPVSDSETFLMANETHAVKSLIRV